MSGYQYLAGVAAALGTMPANGPERLARLVRGKGVRDQRLLEAIACLPRAGFVPPAYSERAYHDEPIPIGHDQVTTQPSLVAAMLEALTLEGKECVLEVGTGYGFQTGLIALLARRAFSIERFPDLAEAARRNLARQGIRNVEVVVGDGTAGSPSERRSTRSWSPPRSPASPSPSWPSFWMVAGWSSPWDRVAAMRSRYSRNAEARSSAER